MKYSSAIKQYYMCIDSSVSSDDKEFIITSVDSFYDQGIFTYNEVVDLCLASGHTKKRLLDDKLEALFSGIVKYYISLWCGKTV